MALPFNQITLDANQVAQTNQGLGNSIVTALGQIQVGISRIQRDNNQMQADIAQIQRDNNQMQADIHQIQVNIANLLRNQNQNQRTRLNRGQICTMINGGIAKSSFENLSIEKSRSYTWVQANIPNFRFYQIKLFFESLINNINQAHSRQIRNPTRDEKRSKVLFFKYLDIFWDKISRYIRNNPNQFQSASNTAKASLVVQ